MKALSITFFSLVLFSFAVDAATISGTVRDNKLRPLPFANVYIQGTTIGTTTNGEGLFEFNLVQGTYTLVFNYIGFEKKTRDIEVGADPVKLDIILAPEVVQISEVVVSAKEDPAYAIMRKAIAKRDYHYNQVESYKCTAYTKGLQRIDSAPDKVFGQTVNFDGSLDSNNAGIIYLSEAISELYFKKPDKVKETMISSKVSGNSQGFSWNRAGDFYVVDFYTSNIRIDIISDRGFISPLSDNAMIHYRFKLLGFFEEDGRIINKIQVTPRRENDPVFTGIIYIVENEWNIHSLDLMLMKQNQMNFLDTLKINQVFVPVEDSVWMMLSQQYALNFEILQIKASGYLNIVYQDYDLEPVLDKRFFTNEILKVKKDANLRDTSYWKNFRPVPLTEAENYDYERKDSLEELKKSPEYLKAQDKKANKFNAIDLLIGYSYRNSFRDFYVTFDPFLEWFQYNTVEGFNIHSRATMEKRFEKNRSFYVIPKVRYGFSNKHFNGTLRTRYNYNQQLAGYVELEGGRYVYQFNRTEPISEVQNMIQTLFVGENYMKLFEESSVRLKHRIEIVNGLRLWSDFSYAWRNALMNTSFASVRKKSKENWTSNDPQNPLNTEPGFKDHQAFIMSFTLRYRPGQRYITRPYEKIAIGSKYPDLILSYRKAIPGVGNSNANFDYIEFKIEDDLRLGLFGNMEYSVKTGAFLNKAHVDFMDAKHFNGNQTYLSRYYGYNFQLLEYYAASTTDPFVEAHVEHHFDGFLFNKIPGVRKLKLQAVIGGHFLYTPDFRDYSEITVGIENIVRVLRVDFTTSLSTTHPTKFGVSIGLQLNAFGPN